MILEPCKGVHCVDIGESFPTHIYLQNLASIQPRTSPLNFAGTSARSRRAEADLLARARGREGQGLSAVPHRDGAGPGGAAGRAGRTRRDARTYPMFVLTQS